MYESCKEILERRIEGLEREKSKLERMKQALEEERGRVINSKPS